MPKTEFKNLKATDEHGSAGFYCLGTAKAVACSELKRNYQYPPWRILVDLCSSVASSPYMGRF